MERKCQLKTRFLMMGIVCLNLLTLLFCSCNSGQVTSTPFNNPDYMQRFTEAIYALGRAIERERCLSTDISTASDTETCFDCHDKIVR